MVVFRRHAVGWMGDDLINSQYLDLVGASRVFRVAVNFCFGVVFAQVNLKSTIVNQARFIYNKVINLHWSQKLVVL